MSDYCDHCDGELDDAIYSKYLDAWICPNKKCGFPNPCIVNGKTSLLIMIKKLINECVDD